MPRMYHGRPFRDVGSGVAPAAGGDTGGAASAAAVAATVAAGAGTAAAPYHNMITFI